MTMDGIRGTRVSRGAVALAVLALTGLATTVTAATPAFADPAHIARASATVQPNLAGGSNGRVDISTQVTNGKVEVFADLFNPFPTDFGHFEILTPNQIVNTPDGSYNPANLFFPDVRGKYCAIWWALGAPGQYTFEGEPCVNDG